MACPCQVDQRHTGHQSQEIGDIRLPVALARSRRDRRTVPDHHVHGDHARRDKSEGESDITDQGDSHQGDHRRPVSGMSLFRSAEPHKERSREAVAHDPVRVGSGVRDQSVHPVKELIDAEISDSRRGEDAEGILPLQSREERGHRRHGEHVVGGVSLPFGELRREELQEQAVEGKSWRIGDVDHAGIDQGVELLLLKYHLCRGPPEGELVPNAESRVLALEGEPEEQRCREEEHKSRAQHRFRHLFPVFPLLHDQVPGAGDRADVDQDHARNKHLQHSAESEHDDDKGKGYKGSYRDIQFPFPCHEDGKGKQHQH